MIEAILKSDIIYIGDYHTCNQSQRSFLRILKSLILKDRNFVIGLELIHSKHQKIIDQFLSGRISDETFNRKIRLREHWVFDLWSNFKPIFDFSKYHNIKVFGIDAEQEGASLKERDGATAKILKRILKGNPGKRLLVFIGDLHIAPAHLPKEVNEIFKKDGIKKKNLILFENSESIYWRLAEKGGGSDQAEVIRLKDGNFCRMHTPPIVCQQSYLNWLEHEEGEIDYDDAKTNFLDLVGRIAHFLKINLGPERDDVEVFTCGDLSFLRKLRESNLFSKKEITTIKRQILSSESYYIAKIKYVYLANLSMNHAAEEASHFIKHLCSGSEKPREYVDAFYANTLHEALGFFGSKLINHKRKCYHEKDFRKLFEYFRTVRVPADRRGEEITARLVLEYKKFENRGQPLRCSSVFYQKMDIFLAVTHALGYMLGDKLYYGMLSGVISKSAIKKLYLDPWAKPGAPYSAYMELIRILKRVKVPKRM